MSKQKDKNKDNMILKLKNSFDWFIILFLIAFICLCIYFKVNTFTRILLVIAFMILLLFVYLTRYDNKNRFSKYKNLLENYTLEEIKEMLLFYYKSLDYKIINQEEFIIEKNKNKYQVKFLLDDFNIENIKNLIEQKDKNIKEIIFIANRNFTTEELNFIKKNKIYTITKNGLINIISNKNKLNKNKKTEDEEEEKEDGNRGK